MRPVYTEKGPTVDPGKCDVCNEPKEWCRKFNSGDPAWFSLPTCECAERETEALVAMMLMSTKLMPNGLL